MYTKEQIWQSMKKELEIIKHLATKIHPDKEHHKLTEKQRSMQEFLQYLSVFGSSSFETFLRGDYTAYPEYKEKSSKVTLANFAAAIDAQEKEMHAQFAKFTDEELKKEIDVWGRKQTKEAFLLDFLKMLCAYKMQLFLYVKHSGRDDISTSNVWAGMDMPAPKA